MKSPWATGQLDGHVLAGVRQSADPVPTDESR